MISFALRGGTGRLQVNEAAAKRKPDRAQPQVKPCTYSSRPVGPTLKNMMKRFLALIGISIGMASIAAAQQPNWTPPKTPWGEPDLQGMWPLNHLISTPFQ